MKTWCIGVAAMMGCLVVLAACSSEPDYSAEYKWLAERTDQFLNLYSVAYNKVNTLQGGVHPCTKGHKAEQAALFHAVLNSLHASFASFQSDVNTKLGKMAETDSRIKTLLSTVDRLATPFIRASDLTQCGKLDKAGAKARFYLQSPLETQAAVKRFRESIDGD